MRELLQDCQRTTTHYEWVVEAIDIHEDIIDCQAFDKLDDLQRWMKDDPRDDYEGFKRFDWGLHRMSGSEADGMTVSQYAYAVMAKLPSHFDGGNIVPKRFHAEIAKHRS